MSKKWTKEEDDLLMELIDEGFSNKDLYEKFPDRGHSAINNRAAKIRTNKPLHPFKGKLEGKKIGNLTVIKKVGVEIDEKYNLKHNLYECVCDCKDHNKIIVRENNLRFYNTTSCGCNKKMTSDLNPNRSFNEYVIYNDIAFVKFTNCNEYFLCDASFWNEFGCKYGWSKNNNGYAESRINYKLELMHRVIMNYPKEYVVDHIFRVSQGLLDNRKCNLRIVSQSINTQNAGLRRHNTSGYTGVGYDKKYNKWYSEISVNKKKHFLGYYKDKKDAIVSRLQAEHDLLGIYAPQRHLFKEFGIDDFDIQ